MATGEERYWANSDEGEIRRLRSENDRLNAALAAHQAPDPAVREAAERLVQEAAIHTFDYGDDPAPNPNFLNDILTVARAVLAGQAGAGEEAARKLAESQRDTWSDVANQMMHERNAARVEAERLRAMLTKRYTNKAGVAYQQCRVCGATSAAAQHMGHWPGCALAGPSSAPITCDACGEEIVEDYIEQRVEGDTNAYHVACAPPGAPMRMVLLDPDPPSAPAAEPSEGE